MIPLSLASFICNLSLGSIVIKLSQIELWWIIKLSPTDVLAHRKRPVQMVFQYLHYGINFRSYITRNSYWVNTPGLIWEPNVHLKLRIHSRTCSENLFFHELPVNEGKMTNQHRCQLCENCWRDRKIFPQMWKRTKIQTNLGPAESRTSLVFLEKNWQEMVRNELFANSSLTPY